MTHEDYIFVADVVVIDLMWEIVTSSVISWSTNVVMEFNAIIKIRKYKGFMRGTTLFQWPWRCITPLGMIWIVSLRSVPIFFMIDNQEVIYPCFYTFNFLSNMLILFLNMIWLWL
jgi:hypothetical protein